MFLLHFLPDSLLTLVINSVLIAGVVGLILVLSSIFLRFLLPYNPAIKLISAILLIIGAYFKGGYGTELEWRIRINEMQQKIEVAEQKAKDATARIDTVVVEKVKIIKEKVNENKKSIAEHKKVINAECRVPDVARMLYNRSVTHEIPGSTADTNAPTTGIKGIGVK